MTELKTESQSTRIVQTQPTAKRRSTKPTAIAAPGGKEFISERVPLDPTSAELATEKMPEKKPRTTKTKKAAQSCQAASRSANQSASTRVKLTWEPSSSIEATLHQFHEQLNATWIAIDQLKATVEQMQAQELRSGVRLPLEPPKAQIHDRAVPAQFSQPQGRPTSSAAQFSGQPAGQSTLRSRVVQQSPRSAIPPFRPASGLSSSGLPTSVCSHRRKTIKTVIRSVLQLPTTNGGIVIEAALWVMASAGLRVGLNALTTAVPILKIPVMLLVFFPALLAAYAALCIPQANRIGIYRLLLLALGLFVGGRL